MRQFGFSFSGAVRAPFDEIIRTASLRLEMRSKWKGNKVKADLPNILNFSILHEKDGLSLTLKLKSSPPQWGDSLAQTARQCIPQNSLPRGLESLFFGFYFVGSFLPGFPFPFSVQCGEWGPFGRHPFGVERRRRSSSRGSLFTARCLHCPEPPDLVEVLCCGKCESPFVAQGRTWACA